MASMGAGAGAWPHASYVAGRIQAPAPMTGVSSQTLGYVAGDEAVFAEKETRSDGFREDSAILIMNLLPSDEPFHNAFLPSVYLI